MVKKIRKKTLTNQVAVNGNDFNYYALGGSYVPVSGSSTGVDPGGFYSIGHGAELTNRCESRFTSNSGCKVGTGGSGGFKGICNIFTDAPYIPANQKTAKTDGTTQAMNGMYADEPNGTGGYFVDPTSTAAGNKQGIATNYSWSAVPSGKKLCISNNNYYVAEVDSGSSCNQDFCSNMQISSDFTTLLKDVSDLGCPANLSFTEVSDYNDILNRLGTSVVGYESALKIPPCNPDSDGTIPGQFLPTPCDGGVSTVQGIYCKAENGATFPLIGGVCPGGTTLCNPIETDTGGGTDTCECIPCGTSRPKDYQGGTCSAKTDTCSATTGAGNGGCYSSKSPQNCDCGTKTVSS